MKTYINPTPEQWSALAKRQTVATADLNETVKSIFNDIQKNGSKAVKKYTSYFDGISIENAAVSIAEIEKAVSKIPNDLKNAIQIAAENIKRFHQSQKEIPTKIETTSGVFCWRESRAIENICSLLPGMKSPTILPLVNKGWSSLHSVIREDDYWEIIEQLKNLGAEGILIIPIEKMIR